jgi:hypothetical protein
MHVKVVDYRSSIKDASFIYVLNALPNVVVKWLMLLLRILEAQGSNLGSETYCHE